MEARNTQAPGVGRAAGVAPPNRFERVRIEDDLEHLEGTDPLPDVRRLPTIFLPDKTQRLITENDSPDVPFRYSINPYRGCEHGCLYSRITRIGNARISARHLKVLPLTNESW